MMKQYQQPLDSATLPDQHTLETLNNQYSDRDYTITLDCSELTCLCPINNQPSFGQLTIEYIPDKLCLKVNSLRAYIQSLRNSEFFQEDLVNQIRDHLAGMLAPRYLQVTAIFQPINGVSMNIAADYHKVDWLPNQPRLPEPKKLLDKPT